MHFDVIIIGGGASGLMAASRIRHGRVAILEQNDRIGAKLFIAGGGKCNVTNESVTPDHYDGDRAFVSAVLNRFTNRDLLAYLQKQRVPATMQDRVVKNQYFLNKSQDIIDLFRRTTSHVKLFLNESVTAVSKGETFQITTSTNRFTADRLVIASGGISYEQIGASDIGYRIAQGFDHPITRTDPALVGFTVLPDQRWFTELSGLSVPITAKVDQKTIRGNALFAHKGITGPAIMVASLWWKKGKIEIDWLAGNAIDRLIKKGGKKNLTTLLPLPRRFSKALLESLSIADKPADQITSDELHRLRSIHAYPFAPAGTFGFRRAEVTRGGIVTDQFDPQTLESRTVPGLYAVGEVLNVTGELGGYNIQWAFSSGWVCGESINRELMR